MAKGTEKVLTVKWIMKDKKVVAFMEEEDSYNLQGKVCDYLDGIESGVKVKVGVEDGKVTFMQIVKKEEQSTGKKETGTTAPEGDFVEITFQACTKDVGVIKYAEDPKEKNWTPVLASAREAFKELKKGDKIWVQFGDVMVKKRNSSETYPKKGIVGVKALEKKEDSPKEEGGYKGKAGSTNDSIERQVALKGAIEILRPSIEKGMSVEEIETLLGVYTKACLSALKNA